MENVCKYCGKEIKAKEHRVNVCGVCVNKSKLVKELVALCQVIKKRVEFGKLHLLLESGKNVFARLEGDVE